MPALPAGRNLARYAAVVAIVLAVGGLYLRQQSPQRRAAALGPVDATARAATGAPAPDFVLEEAGSGRLVRLSDFRGKTVVLNFWATWCVPCREEMPALQQTSAEHAAAGDVVVVGVDYRETDAQVLDFARSLGLTFPLLIDREGTVREAYGVTGLPSTFFVDPAGVVRAQNIGPVTGNLLPDGLRAAGGQHPPAN